MTYDNKMKDREYAFELQRGGIMPTKGSRLAAGYDLFVPEDTDLHIGRQIISHKFVVKMNDNIKGMVCPKSGNAAKGMKAKAECVIGDKKQTLDVRIDADVVLGTVDADYYQTGNPVGTILKYSGKITHFEKLNPSARYCVLRVYLPKGTAISQMEFQYVPYDGGDGEKADKRVGGYGSSKNSK